MCLSASAVGAPGGVNAAIGEPSAAAPAPVADHETPAPTEDVDGTAPDEALDKAPEPDKALVVDVKSPGWATRYGTELGRALLPAREAPASFAPMGAEPALTGTWRTNTIVSSTTGVNAIAYAPDGRLFAAAGSGGLRVWGPDANGIFGWTTILSSTTGLPSNSISALAGR